MKFNEHNSKEGVDKGKRNFLKGVVAGVVGAVSASGSLKYLASSPDLEKEKMDECIRSLIKEMEDKKIKDLPLIETTANENILSEEGWYRLNRIVKGDSHLRDLIKKSQQDAVVSLEYLKKNLN